MKTRINHHLSQNQQTLVYYLGLFPLLAVSHTLTDAVLFAALILIIMPVHYWLAKAFAPLRLQARVLCSVLALALLVSIVQLLLQAYWPLWAVGLGIFLPLIASLDLFIQPQAIESWRQSLTHALSFALLLLSIALLRAALGKGFSVFQLAPGGFIVLAFVFALHRHFCSKQPSVLVDSSTRRKRVTGKIA